MCRRSTITGMSDMDYSVLLSAINPKEGIKAFRKPRYPGFFEDYVDSMSSIYAALKEIYELEESGEREEKKDAFAAAIIEYAKNERDKAGFFKKTGRFVDLQSMLVFYVLPGIVESVGESPKEETQEEADGERKSRFRDRAQEKKEKKPYTGSGNEFADFLARKWNEEFGSAVLAASYDRIYGGFRNGILGIIFGN